MEEFVTKGSVRLDNAVEAVFGYSVGPHKLSAQTWFTSPECSQRDTRVDVLSRYLLWLLSTW